MVGAAGYGIRGGALATALAGGPLVSKQFSNPLSINPTDSIANWNDLAGAGVTASLDTVVTFNGQPTIRLDIPANYAGGACRIGTSGAVCRIPYNYNKTNFAFAIRSSNLAAANNCIPYVGDSTFANFFSLGTGSSSANQPQMQYADNDWMVFKPSASEWVTGGGTPAMASQMRLRLNFNVSNVGTPTSIWVGFVGIMPRRPKPTVIISPDDGFASWQTFLIPLLKHHRIPASFALVSSLVDSGPNYWTESQLLATANDPSGLFEIINHNRVHQNVGQYATAQAYYNDVEVCRQYMRSLGFPEKWIKHHIYPNSIWRDDLNALLAAGGFVSARASIASSNGEMQDQMIMSGDKLRWKLNVIANLQQSMTLADVQTAITTLKSNNGFGFINMHDFAANDGAFICSYDKANQIFGYLASERDAGNIEFMKYTDWYETYCTQGAF